MTLAGKALATEPIGPTWRGVAGVVTCFLTILGGLVMVLLAFLVSQYMQTNIQRSYPVLAAFLTVHRH